ncbi:NAD(P)-dependent dehydrogenase, short-chain alcohol dehydrogenase family [Luteibacter sp. UNCMF331Sha3.1]|uniref:oxidoreductase n=1 Tax=Luteibacter sp. UNCMF331Sha3.1 TaxID=1502760 RepID=UPI0008C0743F|nr:oxidoreductase [Luteibacter sp. UNCMF331Sha3.1]SEM41572.1 NAD(P)-dependent dehydrogenase, short-chain alcohol dehydrogenase family [Luteibacter sp. UNCMF331Sha3.1]
MRTPQTPIHSGFTEASTAADVLAGIDLSGKTAIVTGGYSGIGVETTRALRAAGARVVVPARDLAKAARTLAGIDADIRPMDLADPGTIDAFAEGFLADDTALHILIDSAGIMACPLTRDARGYEMQFATNHLGHFQLAARLWPALRRANGARVVSVSSRGHRFAGVDFDDPHFDRRDYDPWVAYGQSKTANALFAIGLDRRGSEHGVRAFAVHPGAIVTDLARHMSQDDLRARGAIDDEGRPVVDLSKGLKSVAQGASTSVWTATSPRLDGMGGVYCEDNDISPLLVDADATIGSLSEDVGVRPWAVDTDAAERLWTLSEAQTGATFA